MKRKTILIIGGVILGVMVVAGAGLLLYVRSRMEPVPLTISFATVQTPMLEGASCAGGNWSK